MANTTNRLLIGNFFPLDCEEEEKKRNYRMIY